MEVVNTIPFEVIYQFNGITVKSPMMFLAEIEKPLLISRNLKSQKKKKKKILKMKNKVGELILPDFKFYYKAGIIKAV